MLSGFKNFYSKSVDLLKQVQDQVAVKGQAGPAPTVAPEDTHPGFHLVERCDTSTRGPACVVRRWCRRASSNCGGVACLLRSRYERTWGEVLQNAADLSSKVSVSARPRFRHCTGRRQTRAPWRSTDMHCPSSVRGRHVCAGGGCQREEVCGPLRGEPGELERAEGRADGA